MKLEICILSLALGACGSPSRTNPPATPPVSDASTDAPTALSDATEVPKPPIGVVDRVVKVVVSGNTFAVTLETAETGCEQYADWWEVLTTDGKLLYRRILGHSHVDEQPFTRSGGPVDVGADQVVRVRLHMNEAGYSVAGMEGSFSAGFTATQFASDFAPDVGGPKPNGCAF